MRKYSILNTVFILFFAAVWLINGLFCKVLNLVPRHQEIVGNILGESHARKITVLIGVSEVFMAIWILSRRYSRICASLQIAVIAVMNCLEFFLVPELLLWGRLNLLFAVILMALIYLQEFVLQPKINRIGYGI